MKIKFFYGLILILTSLSLGAEPAESSLPRPKLVVGIVVDQMRWDYLYRYYDRYGDRGFKRLLKEGFTCENTQLNYLPAFTAVGHTVLQPMISILKRKRKSYTVQPIRQSNVSVATHKPAGCHPGIYG